MFSGCSLARSVASRATPKHGCILKSPRHQRKFSGLHRANVALLRALFLASFTTERLHRFDRDTRARAARRSALSHPRHCRRRHHLLCKGRLNVRKESLVACKVFLIGALQKLQGLVTLLPASLAPLLERSELAPSRLEERIAFVLQRRETLVSVGLLLRCACCAAKGSGTS